MAREEFLLNLRTATKFLSPTVLVNGVRLEPRYLERALRRATIWLTSRAVEGFDVADYPDLEPSARDRLVRAVDRFRAVADQVPPKAPATEAQLQEAGPAFAEILDIVGPYLQGFDIYHALKRQQFPGYVRDFAVRIGDDSTGDPAAWVWLIVSDDSKSSDYLDEMTTLYELVEQAMRRAGVDRLLYLRFRAASEQFDDIEPEQLEDFARAVRTAS